MTTVDLREGALLPLLNLTVQLQGPDRIALLSSGDELFRIEVESLRRSNFAETWCNQGTCLVVGLAGDTLVSIEADPPRHLSWGLLHRLDLRDGYDPGGIERVQFHDLSNGTVLLEYETGIACFKVGAGLMWDVSHKDPTTHVVAIDGDNVVLDGDGGQRSISLDLGE